MQKDILDFYATPTETTRLGKHVHLAAWLTDDVRALFQVVQGLIVHDRWLERYGTAETAAQHYPGHIAFAEDLLDRAFVLDPRSPAVPRPPEKRVIACCREYALLLCALLRAKGIPARTRCGFATYFAVPGRYEDHWACEYWCDRTKRWIMVDPQIDPTSRVSSVRISILSTCPTRTSSPGEKHGACAETAAGIPTASASPPTPPVSTWIPFTACGSSGETFCAMWRR